MEHGTLKWVELGKRLDQRLEFPDLELLDNVEIDPLEHFLKSNMVSLIKISLCYNQRGRINLTKFQGATTYQKYHWHRRV